MQPKYYIIIILYFIIYFHLIFKIISAECIALLCNGYSSDTQSINEECLYNQTHIVEGT